MSNFEILGNSNRPDSRLPRLSERFWQLAGGSEKVTIVVGYAGTSSLVALSNYVRQNPSFHLELFIGMQFIEGLSRNQIFAIKRLHEQLKSSNRGCVLLSPYVLQHSKLYMFQHNQTNKKWGDQSAYVGSANLDAIIPDYTRTHETGIFVPFSQGEFEDYYTQNIRSLGVPADELQLEPSIDDPSPLEMFDFVEKTESSIFLTDEPDFVFDLPLKDTSSSNLNVFNGKARVNKSTNRQRSRDWYEVEIIVSKSITTQPGYPQHREFEVVTDDGWKFTCVTNGQNAKNLRSRGNLSILGAWIKSRLEQSGSLRAGELVTKETLESYGRSSIRLSHFASNDSWYLDFSIPQIDQPTRS